MQARLHEDWIGQINDLAEACVGAQKTQTAGLLRALHHLCRTGPPELCAGTGAAALSAERLERLIACDAHDSAALAMIGRLGCMMSRSAEGQTYVSLMHPLAGETNFRADCVELAICGALAGALAIAAAG